MILYLVIIGVCSLVVAGVCALAFSQAFFEVLLWTGLAVLFEIVADGITAAVCRLLPPPKEGAFFLVSRKEKNKYERWRIRKWKDKIPEIGHFTGFRKNKIADPKSASYVERFLMESRYGEVGHLLSCPTGALIFLAGLIPAFPACWWGICIGVTLVNAVLNLLPVFVLRYNYYKLRILYTGLLEKERVTDAQSAA